MRTLTAMSFRIWLTAICCPACTGASLYLYAVVCTLGFGMFAGLLAVVTIAISAVIKVKYSVTLILPAFLFLEATVYLGIGTGWYNYIMFFNEEHGPAYGAFIFLLLAVAFTAFGAECSLGRTPCDEKAAVHPVVYTLRRVAGSFFVHQSIRRHYSSLRAGFAAQRGSWDFSLGLNLSELLDLTLRLLPMLIFQALAGTLDVPILLHSQRLRLFEDSAEGHLGTGAS